MPGTMTLNPLFSDGAVFQAGRPIRVFGTGDGTATVTLDGVSATAASRGGFWLAELPARPHGGPFRLEVAMGGEAVAVRDVFVGETILFAGQSNMQFKLRESTTDTAVFGDNPLVRLFTTRRPNPGDRFGPNDGWVPCRREDAPDWPSLPYFTANMIQRRLGCAIGAAVAYQGASTIQSWMPPEAFCGDRFAIPDAQMHPDHFNPEYYWNRPGFLREDVLRQLIPFPFGHVVWYQGESNTTTAEGAIYDKMLEAMVARWRRDFETPGLPFLIVQIADFDGRADAGWNSVQKAQERACGLIPDATLVRSADVCESDAIHPPTKSRLAERLAGRIQSCPGRRVLRALPLLMLAAITTVLGFGKPLGVRAFAGMAAVFAGCLLVPLKSFSDFMPSKYFERGFGWILLVALGTTGYTFCDSQAQRARADAGGNSVLDKGESE